MAEVVVEGSVSTTVYLVAGNGGSDGCNGQATDNNRLSSSWRYSGGTGQGTTTRAFGESAGTLYAGGGGGAGDLYCHCFSGNGGGGGGRGNGHPTGENIGQYQTELPESGATNTGGGAGGGWRQAFTYGSATAETRYNIVSESTRGGSGIAIIRWGY